MSDRDDWPDSPDIVEPSASERAEWPDTTRKYVEDLEHMVSEHVKSVIQGAIVQHDDSVLRLLVAKWRDGDYNAPWCADELEAALSTAANARPMTATEQEISDELGEILG